MWKLFKVHRFPAAFAKLGLTIFCEYNIYAPDSVLIRSSACCYIPDNYAIKTTHADNEYYSKMAATSCWWEPWPWPVLGWSVLHRRAQQDRTVLSKSNSHFPLASLLQDKYSQCYKAASFITEIILCIQGLVFLGEENRNTWQTFLRATKSCHKCKRKYGPTSAVSDMSQKTMRNTLQPTERTVLVPI